MTDKQRAINRANKGLDIANGDPAPQFAKRGQLKSFKEAVERVIKQRKLNYHRT